MPSNRPSNLASSLLVIAVVAAVNGFASVGLLCRSRAFFLDLGFPLAATVTTFQLWAIAVLVPASVWWSKAVALRRLPMAYVLPATFCFCGVHLLENVSLIHNSLLFHCLLRPLSALLFSVVSPLVQETTRGRPPHRGRRLTALVVLTGVLTSLAADPELNWFGALVGVLYVIVSALHEALVVAIQTELECAYVQLLALMAPLAAACLTLLCHVLDDLGNQPVWPRRDAASALWVMCLYAAAIPVTAQLLVVCRLSQLGVQLFGLAKLSVMLWTGYRALAAPPHWRVGAGTLACLAGLARYTSPLVPMASSPPGRRRIEGRALTAEELAEV